MRSVCVCLPFFQLNFSICYHVDFNHQSMPSHVDVAVQGSIAVVLEQQQHRCCRGIGGEAGRRPFLTSESSGGCSAIDISPRHPCACCACGL